MVDIVRIQRWYDEVSGHLTNELLPFWITRMIDRRHGGFNSQFDEHGNDTGVDEKSLIAQARILYTMSSVCRSDFSNGEEHLAIARHGFEFLRDRMWDPKHGGFYWMLDRAGNVRIDKKIAYGQSFGIYALSEYYLAAGDKEALDLAQTLFDLLQKYSLDSCFGGYFEMFDRSWKLEGPGSAGGDRKTLDVHMHLMEALTTLYEASPEEIHRRKLVEIIGLLFRRVLHPRYRTGISQFFSDWKVAPQIKFDIVWGWDRYQEGGMKPHATETTSYGHNVEFAWLLSHALSVLSDGRQDGTAAAARPSPSGARSGAGAVIGGTVPNAVSPDEATATMRTLFDHCVLYGIDREYGGVYVEGSPEGEVYDREKEFWQQAEVLIGMLEAYLLFDDEKYIDGFEKVWTFVLSKGINHRQGEWWPLLTREGEPIWRHMSHSWKINYHTVRAMIQSARRLKLIRERLNGL